jgi:hypothetical protein
MNRMASLISPLLRDSRMSPGISCEIGMSLVTGLSPLPLSVLPSLLSLPHFLRFFYALQTTFGTKVIR